jgi:DNA-binding transcriptional LysR family regulator
MRARMQGMEAGYDWDDLKYFLACWRTGSLAKAGRTLHVDQTTAGRRLAALEESLGARLFEHAARRMVLTPAGESLLEIAQGVEQGAIDLGRRASGADARVEGLVRVATSETLAVTFLARQLSSLHAAHPKIELEIVTGAASLNLLRREADLALRAGPKPTQQSLIVRKLGRTGFGLFASEEYRKRRPRAGRKGPLDGHELVGYCDELAGIPPVRWLEEHGAGSRVALRTNSLLTAAEAARGGWGIAALPVFLGTAWPGLARFGRAEAGSSDFWLVVHPDLQHTGRVRAVIEHLVAVMEAMRATGGFRGRL